MRSILHILTSPEDQLARELMTRQRALPGTSVEVADLTIPEPDYDAVVEKVFQADSVEVW